MKWFKDIFETKSSLDFHQLINDGAKLIDVRTPLEFHNNHIPGAINILSDELAVKLDDHICKEDVIITCCSENSETNTTRSHMASSYLRQLGFENVHTAGSFENLLFHSLA